eukprot:CAMPEP_0177771056 /NCGR_PEP_ID=MMETSP0491_2-20121128/11323_1 /TAXON_ID=63592 /ORGANISM="Tetraselmis chuii, Strain PLY429" /LENGTH=146 /DNA_ID=CAMNT_0019288449 /DNA_START=337 /DNA_END=777 /DNA_ORIENTATION=-
MGCYFGCGTNGNRFAYCAYITLLIAGAAAFAVFGVGFTKCAASVASADSPCQVLINYDPPAASEALTGNPNNITEVASALCEQTYEFAPGTQNYTDCVDCIVTTADCVVAQRWAAFAGIILCLLTLLPCFFCCCCSSRPSDKFSDI